MDTNTDTSACAYATITPTLHPTRVHTPVLINDELDQARKKLLRKFMDCMDHGSQLFSNIRNIFHIHNAHYAIFLRLICNTHKTQSDINDHDIFLRQFIKTGIKNLYVGWCYVVNMYSSNFSNYANAYQRFKNDTQFQREIEIFNYYTLVICSLMVKYNYHKNMRDVVGIYEEINLRYGERITVASLRVMDLIDICSQSEFIVWNDFRNCCDAIEHVIFGFEDGSGEKHYISIDFIHGKLSPCASWSEREEEII